MTALSDLYAKYDRMEAIIARVRPELDELKTQIGPWLRDMASHRPSTEPVEARERYAALQAELWHARNFEAIGREIGITENRSRRLQAQIAEANAEIARLEALSPATPRHAARIAEEAARLRCHVVSYQKALDEVGMPRDMVEANDG